MTGEEAIRCLSVHSSTNGSGLCTDEQHYEAKQMGIEAIEQTRWIPVSERLPEDGTWNLFTDGNMVSVERYKADAMDHFYPNGRWFSLNEAIAWMPLPKLESAYDKCPICVNRNKNCQFRSLDCHFEKQIDVAESESKEARTRDDKHINDNL